MSGGVAQDLCILSIGFDNNPWGQYQPLIFFNSFVNVVLQRHKFENVPIYVHYNKTRVSSILVLPLD
jgi:hypothetical protein